jgi:5-methyltetrahydrofolate--homocysteine methyltransferase
MELSKLGQALLNLNEKEMLNLINTKLNENENPLSIVEELRIGIQAVGDLFEKGEYFLAELIAAAKFFDKGIKLVEPKLTKPIDEKTSGKIVIGTVAGDIHDLGKNIVIIILKVHGFEVHDLGVDVPIQTFIEKVKEIKPDIVGVSCLLTTSIEPMKKTIEGLRDLGAKGRSIIMIGGGIVSERVREYVGADYWGANAVQAVSIAKSIMGNP